MAKYKKTMSFKGNPKNPESDLFKRLTRFFSGPIADYRSQVPRELKRRQLKKYKFTNSAGGDFAKSMHNPFSALQTEYMVNQDRLMRYADYEQMEYMPEISSALDLTADTMTTFNHMEPILRLDSPNQEIKFILKDLFYNILAVEQNLHGWCRSLLSKGDFFLYLDAVEGLGIKNVLGLPAREMERLEGLDEDNPSYVQFQWNTQGATFESWQMCHFRILGNDRYLPYGSSFLDASRRIWKQLQLLEDFVISYRIVRTPERRVFYIDVGNIHPDEIEPYMKKVQTEMKRRFLVDENTGEANLRFNPHSIEEDYFIAVRGDKSGTKIESVPGGQFTGDIEDIEYLRDKLFSALKIPQSYLSKGKDGSAEDKTTLAQKDLHFARTVQRLQNSVVSELRKMATVHLFLLGFTGRDLLNFDIKLNNPSKIAEMQSLEEWRTKFDVASAATENFFSRRWIAKTVFNLSDEEIVRNNRERFFDRKLDALLAEPEPQEEGGGMGLGGGEDAGGIDDIFDDTADEKDSDTAVPGKEEDILLASPGKDVGGIGDPAAKRTEKLLPGTKYTTPGAKGKAYTKRHDAREMGARQRNIMALTSRETASNTPRNVFKGLSGLTSLSRGILENKEEVEEEFLRNSGEIQDVLRTLEKIKEDKKFLKEEVNKNDSNDDDEN